MTERLEITRLESFNIIHEEIGNEHSFIGCCTLDTRIFFVIIKFSAGSR